MKRDRRGFTFLELLTVLLVLGILAGIAMLRYIDLKHRAVSAQVISDLEAIRLGAYNAYYDTQAWPAEAGPGVVPVELAPYLGRSFSFARSDYTLDWENFVPPGGGPSGGMQLGVVVSSTNSRLMHTLDQMLGNKLPFVIVGGTLTYVIIGADGRF